MAKLVESGALAADQLTGKSWRIKVIEGDRQGSSAYYPKEALQEGAALFAPKTKIYLNHPTEDDKFNIPARRVQDIVGYLSEGATFDGKDLYANATFLPKYQQEIKDLAEAGLIGMSIRAEGEISEASGTKTLTKFTRVNSVDVVTSAGAGGGFDRLLESASASESGAESTKEKESVMEKEIVEALATLKTDLTASIAEAITAAMDEAAKKANPFAKKGDKAAADAEDAKDGGKDDADENPDGSKKKKPVKESATFAQIDAALTEAKLPAVSRTTVFALVEGGADLKESVDAEAAKVQAILTEAGASFRGYGEEDGVKKSLQETTAGMVENIYGIKAVTGS